MTTSLLGKWVKGKYHTGAYKNDLPVYVHVEGEVVAVTGSDYLYLWVRDNEYMIRKVPYTTAAVPPQHETEYR